MRYINISLLLIWILCGTLSAQSAYGLSQARTDLKNREYTKAIEFFKKQYVEKPNDPSIALSYGICLVETCADLKKAEEALLIASKRNLPESYLYLGDLYIKDYRVGEAELLYAKYGKARPKDKESLKQRSVSLAKMKRFIARTEDIQVIDSLLIDKDIFLEAYKLSSEAGTLSAFRDVFPNLAPNESVVYTNGKGSKIYFGQTIENRSHISTMDKLLTGFGDEKLMSDTNFGLSGDTNFPFVLTDGITTYFAGKDEEGMGGYDIYVTRYNLNTDTYLNPELLNMPFNSPANDYLMVYDEIKGVGWFATDRFQTDGKVCVYTFLQNNEVKLLDTDDEKYRENRARLSSIRDTWRPGTNYSQLINKARKDIPKTKSIEADFTFIVNDTYTYNSYDDFKSSAARRLFSEWEVKREELYLLENDLQQKRDHYHTVAASRRSALSSDILELEKKQAALWAEVKDMEVSIRNKEITTLKQ